jgi:RecA-family ATPase
MCICIARGIPFLGRQTQQGLILYLAVESPASVMTRLQVYHYHYGIKIPNFVIVKNPINLFDGEDDAQKIIKLIKMVEKNTGKKVLLVVGDTLARLSAGGNECAGQDMGVVVKHVDKIRNESNAHFLLIHHSGKNASAKGRGWSGLRAAVDTEIEVTETLQGKCAEITKQRDLNTKGEKIGFKLLTIPLSVKSNFGKAATGAIVLSDKVPEPIVKFKKRSSPVYYAIFEFVKTRGGEVFKVDAMKELSSRFKSSTIYDQILNLVEDEKITDEAGLLKCI